MRFDWDNNKSKANEEKHGISFEDAALLFEDPDMIRVKTVRGGETRYVVIAHGYGSCWTAIYTERGDTVRIISVRRATKKEARYYDQVNQ